MSLDPRPELSADSATPAAPADNEAVLSQTAEPADEPVWPAAMVDDPYAPRVAGAAQILTPELMPEPVVKPRVWPALLVGILAIPAAAVVSTAVLLVAILASGGVSVFREGLSLTSWLEDFSQTRFGLSVIVLPGQLVFLAIAVGAAWLSPLGLNKRLALRWGGLPLWSWIVLMLGTPIIGVLSSHLLSFLVDEMSDQLKLVEAMMRAHIRDFPIGLIAIVAVIPGFVEELLFRGYLQSRLLRRWPPVLAVGVSALVFSAAHLDPIHVLGVIPLGLWLGTIAWRAGSVWPAMLCHAVNNAVAVVATMFQDSSTLELTLDPFSLTLLGVGGPAFLLSLGLLAFAPPLPRED